MNLKQFIFDRLEKGHYITDTDLAKFCKGEPNFYQAETYKQEFARLQKAKNDLAEYETHPYTKIHKYRPNRKHAKTLFALKNEILIGVGRMYKIPKVYFDYLKNKGLKEE